MYKLGPEAWIRGTDWMVSKDEEVKDQLENIQAYPMDTDNTVVKPKGARNGGGWKGEGEYLQ